MGKFNFEDYRHPWETGPHWELKKEFMEKYSDMFPEDRLLCLAQAYSNIVLMNCSYPEPVMRQISLLSKPLQMRKRFQENDKTEDPPQKGKRKFAFEDSGKQIKFIKFCSSKTESSSEISSHSTVLPENGSEQFPHSAKDNTSISVGISSVLHQSEFSSSVNEKSQNEVSDFSSNVQNKVIENSEIVNSLGLAFVQNYVQEVMNIHKKVSTVGESLVSAAQKLKILSEVCFKTEPVPNCPPHAPLFMSEFFIKGCLISSVQGGSKKKAKANCAEKALDTLYKLSVENLTASNAGKPVSGDSSLTRETSITEQTVKNSCVDVENTNFNPMVKFASQSSISNVGTADMKELQTFSQIIASAKSEKIKDILHAAKILKFRNDVELDVTLQESEYICKFSFKNILISTAKDTVMESAKELAVKFGVQKLKNLSGYEIANGELIERENSARTFLNLSSSSSNLIQKCDFQSTPFILNRKMFEASMRDGFVLLDSFSVKSVSQRNMKAMLSSSASFCRKHFEYKFEDITTVFPPMLRVSIVIGDKIVASAVTSSKDEGKTKACDLALQILKKKYYTIKVKNEYIEGYIITRSQVFEGESFSSNAITDSNIGCKMLKSMGWTGGGLGTSGIAEPIEAGQNSYGRGLGYSGGTGDMDLFKKRINSMLQDFNQSTSISDLVFSKEFTKDERKVIHNLVLKFNLRAGSQGKGDNRFLTVRHKYTVNHILQHLANNGGSSSKYELVDATDMSFDVQDVCSLIK